jgi:predicted phage baseplate assembly protein
VALHNRNYAAPVPFLVHHVTDLSPVDFAISAKVSGVALANPDSTPPTQPPYLYMRDTNVFVQSEALTLTDAPIDDTVGTAQSPAQSLVLDRMVLGLSPGQKVTLSGITVDLDGNATNTQATELCTLTAITHRRGYTVLDFQHHLANAYVRSSISVNGNIAPATHGETVPNEIMGSGDASKANQVFTLKKSPLTYVSTPSGSQSTLTVRVNSVAWTEVPTLYGAGPNDTVYTVRNQYDGSSDVCFGDGHVGARLPTGSQNIVATYRNGIGPLGDVDTGVISLLQSRPLGLKSVLNPVPATGAAPPETLSDARRNAPRTVRTLDRVVSLSDFQDFARGFPGVGKALAVPLWSGETQIVHITIGSTQGGPLDPTSSQWSNLIAGMQAAGDSAHQVRVDNFQPRYFKLQASIVIDPAYDIDMVVGGVTSALQSAFAFDARDLAQSVTESEIIEYAQAIAGVIAIEIGQLYRTDESPGLSGTVPAAGAHFVNGGIVPAELLLLHPVGLSLVGANP